MSYELALECVGLFAVGYALSKLCWIVFRESVLLANKPLTKYLKQANQNIEIATGVASRLLEVRIEALEQRFGAGKKK